MKKFLLLITSSILISITVISQELLPTSTTGKVIEHTYFTLSNAQDFKQAVNHSDKK